MENNDKIIHSGFWANIFKSSDQKETGDLLDLPPFRLLEKRDLSLLMTIIHDRTYLAGEYIFYQGDPGIGLYILKEGTVEIVLQDDFQNHIPLASFSRGDFFGELALVDGEKRSASAIARTDVKLSVMFKPDVDEFIEKHPKKGVKILQALSQIIAIRLRQVNEDMGKFLGAGNEKILKD